MYLLPEFLHCVKVVCVHVYRRAIQMSTSRFFIIDLSHVWYEPISNAYGLVYCLQCYQFNIADNSVFHSYNTYICINEYKCLSFESLSSMDGYELTFLFFFFYWISVRCVGTKDKGFRSGMFHEVQKLTISLCKEYFICFVVKIWEEGLLYDSLE